MRILWWSNAPWAATGYGVQTALFAPRIKALGHEVAIFAFYGLRGSRLGWEGIDIYPQLFDRFGNDAVSSHAEHFKADVVISLVDVAACAPQAWRSVRWAPWFPVDGEPIRPGELERLRRAYLPIVYSHHGERMCKEAGLDARYVPHGVDTQLYKPMPRREAREKIGLQPDVFIAGIVGANKGIPSRKAFPEQILAFKRLKERHPDAMLYIHAHQGQEMEGLNLPALVRAAGLSPKDVAWVGQYQNLLGSIGASEMMLVYNALDVLLNASHGEGFGVPILEAQACGTPAIVGDWTAMPEVCFAGWKIPKDEAEPVWTRFNSWQWSPHVDAVYLALEKAYRAAGSDLLRAQARRGALEYDADLVAWRYWAPVLSEMDGWVREGKGDLELVTF